MTFLGRARADLKPRVENSDWCVRLSVGWLSRTATRRPDKSSRLGAFSNRCRPHPFGKRTLQEPCSRPKRIPFSWVSFGGETQLCASLFKSAPPRTLPVAPFHSMAPCPLDLCVLDHTWCVRCLGSCPVSLLALGGLAVPPPDIFRHSAPSPRQVSRQGHADQQSWFFEPHHPPRGGF